MTRALLALFLVLALTPAVLAEDTAAAILMVSDSEQGPSERLGVAVYGRFLEEGPYSEVATLRGDLDANEKLSQAIRDLAQRHDAIDIFLSIHPTFRDAETWSRLVPPSARKVRLVYSTACFGEEAEHAAWDAVGAQAVVTHSGLNNPLIAMPYVLSEWIGGAQIGDAVAKAYRETQLLHALGIAIPLVREKLGRREFETERGTYVGNIVSGSRPVITGDTQLRINSGLSSFRPRCPDELTYDRQTGGALGLAMRAAAGRYAVMASDISTTIEALTLGRFTIGESGVKTLKIESFHRAQRRSGPIHQGGGTEWVPAGRLAVELKSYVEDVSIPLFEEVELVFKKRFTVTPGVFDPEQGRIRLVLSGVWLRRGDVSYRINSVTLLPWRDGGYQLRLGGGWWGFVPTWFQGKLPGSVNAPEIPEQGPRVIPRKGISATIRDQKAVPGGR